MTDRTSSTLDKQTEVGSYFVATYPPFSAWTTAAVEQDGKVALETPPVPECRSASTCTFRSAGSGATSATSASIPTRTPKRSMTTWMCSRVNGSCARRSQRLPGDR